MEIRVVDIHEHLLYGMDDGPSDRRGMFAMLDAAAQQGITVIVATPHVTPGIYCFDVKQYNKSLSEAKKYCADKLPGLTIYGGAEVMYTPNMCRFLSENQIPTMAETNHVLVEFPVDIRFEAMREAVSELISAGFRPVLAHVERYRCLTVWPQRAVKLKQLYEVFYQINCSVVLGESSLSARLFADRMLRLKLIDALASDAHGISARPNRLAKALASLTGKYGEDYAMRLVSGQMLEY